MKKVIMPKLGLTMKKGTIIKWFKREGERVEKGEPLFEVETEKVTEEIEAPDSGILYKIIAPEGSVVPVVETIAIIAEPDEELPEEKVERAVAEEEKAKPPEAMIMVERLLISPAAKKLAKEHEIDITKIKGSGPSGRIIKEDILRAIKEAKVAPPVIPAPPAIELVKVAKVIPMTSLRKTIAERMSKSHLTAPHIMISTEVDMTESVKFREKLLAEIEETARVRLSYTDILVKAVARALRNHPIINSTLEGERIKIFEDVNIGVAVALEDGLIVPVVFNADRKSLVEIAPTLKELTERARQGTLSLDEVTGGTFTITNLGMFGIDVSTPIINPPQSAILGIGRIVEKPVVINGQIVIRSMMSLSLSADHRVVDGAQGAKFLQEVKKNLENPYLLM